MKKDYSHLKKIAAEKAVEQIESGMIVGLGTGSTANFAIRKIGELISNGKLKNIKGIPSSIQSEKEAQKCGIQLVDFSVSQSIDITIDGADEVDDNLNLIKGGGGALLREKILAQASKKEIIVIDETKRSKILGLKWHVPVEVIKFAAPTVKSFLESIGAKVKLRMDANGKIFTTDEENYILDSNFGEISEPENLARKLEARAGIVEHGLFVGLTSELIVASDEEVYSISK